MLEEKKDANLDGEKDKEADETAKKNEGEDTPKNDLSDNEDDTSDEDVDVEKQEEGEEDPYAKKLKELEDDLASKEEQIKQKNAALREERDKRKQAEKKQEIEDLEDEKKEIEEEKKYLTPEEADKIFEKKLQKQRDLDKIERITANENERKLITKFYEQGYSVDDAYLKANAHIIEEHKRMEQEREEDESQTARYSSGVSRGSRGSSDITRNPVLKQAADGLTPEERKHLKI